MERLMTIGVFAERTGLSVSAVRFYGSQQLLVPREVDASNGYRLYADDQIADGILIRDLRRLELSLHDIAAALGQSEAERRRIVERHLLRLEETVKRAHTLAQAMGIPNAKQETSMTASLHTPDLAKALDQVLSASGTDPERPDLMGVLVEAKGGSIRFAATDSYRLAIRDLVPAKLDGEFQAVVPAATVAQWRTALEGQGDVTLTLVDDLLEVRGPVDGLSARTVAITFPDYEPFLVPVEHTTTVRVNRDELIAALDRVDLGGTVTLTTSGDGLRVASERGSVGVDGACDGPPQHLGINGRFLSDAVLHAVGGEVIIEVEDPLRPVLFRSADDGTFTVRVMPVRLDEPSGGLP